MINADCDSITLWAEEQGGESVLPFVPFSASMLVLAISNNKAYAFVLACGSLGYVTLNKISKAF